MVKDLKTAVLIFAHSAEYEATVKSFKYSKEVFESLNQHTLQVVKKTKLPYFVITEKEQIGSTFGERFTNAMQSIYNLGYQSLIIIGNDTPHLKTNQILNANSKLAKNEIVVGSSLDGGFYLLGIQKEHFNQDSFLKLPWQTQNIGKSLSNLFLLNAITVSYLKKLADIDSFINIKKILNTFKKVFSILFNLLLKIISPVKKPFIGFHEIIPFLLLSTSYNKGSPVSI